MLEQLKKDLETKSFQIMYKNDLGETGMRLITPLAITHSMGGWGVLAWCHRRQNTRWFILDRIKHMDPVDRAKTFTTQELVRLVVGLESNQQWGIKEAVKMEEKEALAKAPQANDYYLITDQKKYTHDCDKCAFLGHIDDKEPKKDHRENYDLYICRGKFEVTVIARYDSEGSQYMSGLEIARSIVKNDPERAKSHPLVIAMALAYKRGLLTKEECDG